MLSTLGDIKNDVLVKLNTSTTLTYYTDSMLNTWINEAYMWAASYKKWPFTESVDTSLTFSAGTETYTLPSGFKTDSVRILTVGTSPAYNLTKVDFQSYRVFRELQTSSDSSRFFSEFGRTLYINPNLDVTGTITLYGQKNVTAMDGSIPTSTSIFSNYDEEGNEAIAYKVLSYAMMRERDLGSGKKGITGESAAYALQAQNILDALWMKMLDERFAYQEKNRGMFTRMNVLRGAFQEEIFRRDQFF